MNSKLAQTFYAYGGYLLFCGVAGFLSNPERAKTALISGGVFGLLSIASGFLIFKGSGWGIKVGRGILALLAVVFLWRSYASWHSYLAGNSDKLLAAALITSMLVATIFAWFRIRRLSLSPTSL